MELGFFSDCKVNSHAFKAAEAAGIAVLPRSGTTEIDCLFLLPNSHLESSAHAVFLFPTLSPNISGWLDPHDTQ